jgi:type 2 lantibiotic biosynthesis protein LanM
MQPSCLATGFVSDIHTTADGRLADVGGLRGRIPAPHRPDFIAGFDAAYRFFQQHPQALLAGGGPLDRFAGQWTRVIGRPTDQYASLLALLAAPKYQQSGAQRSTAIDALNRAFSLSELRPALWSLTADERRSLERLDIPLFHAATDQPHVFCEGRQVLADHFAQPGLHAVRERLQGLGDADRAHQVKILRRSIRESVDSRFATELVLPSAEGATPALGTRVVGHALWIAEECLTLAAEPSDDRGQSAADFVLYDGELGSALFYAAVAATAGSEQAASAAREILARFSRSDAFEAGDRPLGACTGDGSLIYALACIAGLLDDEMPIELASRIARTITPARAYTDEHLDVSSGAAGAIFALLALHARTGEKDLLQRAASCGERLLATRITFENGAAWRAADGRLYVGFAHGAAGIGLALVRLSQATGRQDFLDAAGAAHRFERRAYLPEARNWPIAAADAGGGVEMMTAWCHGAPGLALARTRAAVALSDRSLLNGVEQALKTTAAVPVRLDDHMCCGSMGRCDVLLTSGLALAADQAVTAAWTLAGQVVDRAERERRYRLTSRGHQMRVFDTGFFRGLSGIGYQLLRLAAPSRLPSVLSFDPPSQRLRS